MVTVRTYANPIEAGIAKSLLDDCEIFCVLADEDTNRYSGAPFAVPIRSLVHENQVDQALRILSGDLQEVEKFDTSTDAIFLRESTLEVREAPNKNPWELLILALFFCLPAICVLRTKYPAVVATSWRVRHEIAAVTIIHFLGWLSLGLAAFLIVAYFRVSRLSASPENDRFDGPGNKS
jgi:Putative prokaryotic signal transducing protein